MLGGFNKKLAKSVGVCFLFSMIALTVAYSHHSPDYDRDFLVREVREATPMVFSTIIEIDVPPRTSCRASQTTVVMERRREPANPWRLPRPPVPIHWQRVDKDKDKDKAWVPADSTVITVEFQRGRAFCDVNKTRVIRREPAAESNKSKHQLRKENVQKPSELKKGHRRRGIDKKFAKRRHPERKRRHPERRKQ